MTVRNINIDFTCERIVKRPHTAEQPAVFVFTEKQLEALQAVKLQTGDPLPQEPEIVKGEVEVVCNGKINTYSGESPFVANCDLCGAGYAVSVEDAK